MMNGLMYGSINPLHNNHIALIKTGLEHFDLLHIFVRSEGDKDLVGYETKKQWLETLGGEFGGRLRVYPLDFPEEVFDADGRIDLVKVFLRTEQLTGVHADGLITGDDKKDWIDTLQPAFPERKFVMVASNEVITYDVRENLELLKDDVPAYVYESLHNVYG